MGIEIKLFDTLMSLGGGILIGLATTLNLLLLGKLTGMSSMTYTIFTLNFKEGLKTKLCLLFGILTATFPVFYLLDPPGITYEGVVKYYLFNYGTDKTNMPNMFWSGIDIYGFGLGALLVGFGTKLGNGCTSGHAVCGVPRFSLRSTIATGLFLAFGIGMATLKYHANFFNNVSHYEWISMQEDYKYFGYALYAIIGALVVIFIIHLCIKSNQRIDKIEPIISFLIGLIFGAGLMIGGMCQRSKIIGFLTIKDGWDPSLMFVMVGALGVNFITFHFILKREAPIFGKKFDIPQNKAIEWNIIAGPILFGIGWGLSGFCPGPGMVNLLFYVQMLIFIVLMGIGQFAAGKILPMINTYLKRRNEAKLLESSSPKS
jgi:uncharacterized protein